ncbi:hypothetical protein EIN_391650 [Entamoeba invadens IP1]|uniref:MAGE domain-containing protein n=1 Tax=Entamoeba invadens IP1 TaxID=370355 RepID=A0A0A1U5C3_ENTIV|nr:hypothetical protein EIN_391650 [Entamoeba invadens IP1]ELP89510.1 hypothetical protein EIN_391650 [Entamoeba invadens IP1]|eukprot:XP_004256281.1 hypothetical protein EIN_391650 [Entamoeba invadens IP1]
MKNIFTKTKTEKKRKHQMSKASRSHSKKSTSKTQEVEAEDLYLEDSDSEVEEVLSPKKPKRKSSSQRVATQSKRGELSPEEFNSIVNDIVRKALTYQSTKKILTREDIVRTVFAKYKVNPRNKFKNCIEEATARLKKQFGMELKEIKTSPQKSSFILLDYTPMNEDLKVLPLEGMTHDEVVVHGITFIILALTSLNGEAIFDDTLIAHLQTLDITAVPGQPSLQVFIDKVLTKQYYLRRIILTNDNGTKTIKYSTGARAYAELGKDGLYSWIAKIHGDELAESEKAMFKKETENMLKENYDEAEDANLIDN